MSAAYPESTYYKWYMPAVGADTGAWGSILNAIIAQLLEDGYPNEDPPFKVVPGSSATAYENITGIEDFYEPGAGSELEDYFGNYDSILDAAANTDGSGTGVPPGIDQTVWLLQCALDLAEIRIDDIESRVTTLQDATPALLGARLYQTNPQNLPGAFANTEIVWGTVDYADGATTTNTSRITVPPDGAGLWEFSAQVTLPSHMSGGGLGNDNRREVNLYIVRNDTNAIVAHSRLPELDDGSHSTYSEEISIEAATLVVVTAAEEGVEFSVVIDHGQRSSTVATLSAATASWFQGMRVSKEQPD